MTNDELKALYEKYLWAWNVEFFGRRANRWIELPCPDVRYWPNSEYRLKPKLPADLPEPTEDMMNRAVYLGRGPIKLPNEDMKFQGFMCWAKRMEWDGKALNGQFDNRAYYCIDVTDPNAEAIIALNRAEAKKPFDVEVETHPVAEMVQSVLNDRIQYLLSIDEQSIRDALIELGWTPPGESEWLRLDGCEFQLEHQVDAGRWISVVPEAAGHSIVYHGPASVRVRKKR